MIDVFPGGIRERCLSLLFIAFALYTLTLNSIDRANQFAKERNTPASAGETLRNASLKYGVLVQHMCVCVALQYQQCEKNNTPASQSRASAKCCRATSVVYNYRTYPVFKPRLVGARLVVTYCHPGDNRVSSSTQLRCGSLQPPGYATSESGDKSTCVMTANSNSMVVSKIICSYCLFSCLVSSETLTYPHPPRPLLLFGLLLCIVSLVSFVLPLGLAQACTELDTLTQQATLTSSSTVEEGARSQINTTIAK